MKSLFGVGAVLSGGLLACASVSFAQDFDRSENEADMSYFAAGLYGEQVKGGDKDATGDFTAEANLASGKFCYFLEVDGVSDATHARLIPASKGKGAGMAIDLQIPAADTSDDICTTVDTAVLGQIAKKPSAFVVEVMSAAKPAGALRGKLEE